MPDTMEGVAEPSTQFAPPDRVAVQLVASSSRSSETVVIPVTNAASGRHWLPEIDDERANQLTHGAALAMSLFGSVILLAGVLSHGDALQIAGVLIYAVTNLALFTASTLSHSFADNSRRDFWRTVDQVCIFLMMAGTFTPVAFAACRDGWSSGLIVAMWLVAFAGVAWKLVVAGLENVSVWFYVVLGFIPLLVTDRLFATLGTEGVSWIAAGGVSYLIGLGMFLNDHRGRFVHAGWHLMVIIGSVCHYVVVLDCSVR